MRKAIVIPNGVRDPAQAYGSRNQPTSVIPLIWVSLAVCAAWEEIAFFYRAPVPSEFRFL